MKSLEDKGYVKCRRSCDDERVLMVEIMESGEALKQRAVSIPERVAGCVKLDTDEALELYRLLYKVLAALEK